MKVCGAEVGGEQDDDTVEGEEETGGLDGGRASPSPPAEAAGKQKGSKVGRETKVPPCLSARVMGESCPGTAQPRRRSGGDLEVPPVEKPGGRGKPWLSPAVPGVGRGKEERLVQGEARGKEERGPGKRW